MIHFSEEVLQIAFKSAQGGGIHIISFTLSVCDSKSVI